MQITNDCWVDWFRNYLNGTLISVESLKMLMDMWSGFSCLVLELKFNDTIIEDNEKHLALQALKRLVYDARFD